MDFPAGPELDKSRRHLAAAGVVHTDKQHFGLFLQERSLRLGKCPEPFAREMFPIAERRDATPWLGRRPCLPDMLPIIGRAPRHPGLWFDFGHQHLGLTLGPGFGFNDTFAMEIRGEDARRLNLRTLSQAAAYAPQWRAGFGY